MKLIKITSALFILLLSASIFVKCKKDNIVTKNTSPNKEINKVNYLFNPLSRDIKLFENYYNGKGNYNYIINNEEPILNNVAFIT